MRECSHEGVMGRHPYTAAVLTLLTRIEETQREAIEQAVAAVFGSLKRGGILHVFGTGHSLTVAQEAFHRAGGLVPVNLIQDAVLSALTPPAVSGKLERLPGVAAKIGRAH